MRPWTPNTLSIGGVGSRPQTGNSAAFYLACGGIITQGMMHRRTSILGLLAVALAVGATPVFAASWFDTVPANHWTYRFLDDLTTAGLLRQPVVPAGDEPRLLTRSEMAWRIVPMLATLQGGADANRYAAQAAQELVVDLSGSQRAILGWKLEQLVSELRDELSSFGIDPTAATRAVQFMRSREASLEFRIGSRDTAGVTLRQPDLASAGARPLLAAYSEQLPTTATPLRVNPAALGGANFLLIDPQLYTIGGEYAHDLGSRLSLSLGYETLMRQGSATFFGPDATNLMTFGVEWKASRSTGLLLRYRLIDRPEILTAGERTLEQSGQLELRFRF